MMTSSDAPFLVLPQAPQPQTHHCSRPKFGSWPTIWGPLV